MESSTNKSEWLEEAPVYHAQGWQIKFLYCSGSMLDYKIAGASELVTGPEMFNIKIIDTEQNFQIRSP